MAEGLRVKLSVYVFGDDHGDEILAADIAVIDGYTPEDWAVGFAAEAMWHRVLSAARIKIAKDEEDDSENG